MARASSTSFFAGTRAGEDSLKRLRIFERNDDGFVLAEDGTEYFFHQSACTSTPFDSMREGQAVTFQRGQGPKGPRAENVQPA